MISLPHGIDLVQSLFEKNEQYYLVGGAVRDGLLSRSSHDLDIVCTGDTRTIARKLSDRIGGAFFMLDEERNTCRVISIGSTSDRMIFDFSQLRGASLEVDLYERDFTINAMAVDLANPDKIIDPLKGGRDLVEKKLKPCKETSFADDPLRVIRAVRYSVKYDLRIETDTITRLKQAIEKLKLVSKERKRDELFKILENSKPWIAMELLDHFGIIPFIGLSDIHNIDQALSRLHTWCKFTSFLAGDDPLSGTDYFLLSSLVMAFKHDQKSLKNYLLDVNQSGRSRISLDCLTTLLWDVETSTLEKIIDELALSREEQLHIVSIIELRNSVSGLWQGQKLDDRKIYKYFRSICNRGVDLALLSLVQYGSNLAAEINQDVWIEFLEIAQQLINAWFEKPDVVNPKLLLSGRDLMFEFDLIQGPLIGRLLDGLREEQASGCIRTRQAALDWIEDQINPNMITN